ncbi:MAG TPA: esterase [Gammaproteobacteria bacterium]
MTDWNIRTAAWKERLQYFGRTLHEYLGPHRWRRSQPIDDRVALARFLDTRASYIAQTSLYGYLRTRAGMRFPELFDDDPFVVSINIAKWHVWLACLSDLAVYTGGMLLRSGSAPAEVVGQLIRGLVEEILAAQGVPEGSDEQYPAHADRVRARVAGCDWTRVTDDDGPFSQSPAAVVRWAPIIDELKELDEGIVLNSVRFRWHEVRRDLRRNLDADGVLRSDG